MSKVKKERTSENIEKEIDELTERGFDITRINLILSIEKKLNRFIYPSISNKITAENLRDIKRVIENSEDFKIGNVTMLFKAAQRNINLEELNILDNPESLNIEIEALSNGYHLNEYLTPEMQPNVVRTITTFLTNGINPEKFKSEEFNVSGLNCLNWLAQTNFKNKKESFEAFFDSKMSPQQFQALIEEGYFKCNEFGGVLCNEELSIDQIHILARAKVKKGLYIDDIADPKIDIATMKFFVKTKKEGYDMSEFYLSGLNVEVLESIYNCKKHSINYSPIIDNKISPERAYIINKAIEKNGNKYSLSALFDMSTEDEVAKSIYFLQTKGYNISKQKELEI